MQSSHFKQKRQNINNRIFSHKDVYLDFDRLRNLPFADGLTRDCFIGLMTLVLTYFCIELFLP